MKGVRRVRDVMEAQAKREAESRRVSIHRPRWCNADQRRGAMAIRAVSNRLVARP